MARLPFIVLPAARRILAVLICLFACACATAANNSSPPPGARIAELPDYTKQGGIWRYRVVHEMHTGGYRSDMDQGEFEIQIRKGQYRRYRIEGGKRVTPE